MRYFILAAIAGLGLTACETTTTQSMVAPTVVDDLVGKRLVNADGGMFVFNADGTMSGMLRGESVVGVYTADANEVCSTYTAPANLTGREYCSKPTYQDNMIVFVRRDGSSSAAYRIDA